ncbi:MAG: SAVED domain-containing protein [Parcubacteria group bacterium]|jgi:hypothetical protein
MTKKLGDKNKINAITETTRSINNETKLLLAVKSGGRCEFFGCNDYLFSDKITKKNIKWGEFAHIYAFKEDGPRGNKKLRPDNINDVDNLMLLCPSCHTKIDKMKNLPFYTVEILRKQKKEHEDRIKLVSGFKNTNKTKALGMSVSIENEAICVSEDEITEALMAESRYQYQEKPNMIDFSNVPSENTQLYWKSKCKDINIMTEKFYEQLKRDGLEHVSVFAIGPIPLLVYLGSKLENKIKTQLFQRHRDSESWKWNDGVGKVGYKLNIINGKDKSKVALVLSLSGKIHQAHLPKKIDGGFYVYEITLDNQEPNFYFLKSKDDLDRFGHIYSKTLSEIRNGHPKLKEIHLFSAIPAPIAVVCGRALNRKADTSFKIYNPTNGAQFKYALKIN